MCKLLLFIKSISGLLNLDSSTIVEFSFISVQFCTHTFFNLVSDCLYDSGAVALTQFLSGLQVVTGRLHLLLLKCHHGVLRCDAAKTLCS